MAEEERGGQEDSGGSEDRGVANGGRGERHERTDRATEADGDTFRVGIRVAEEELRFLVEVPSDIDSGWADPDEFQRLVERIVWERLDQESVLRSIAASTPAGETVVLGSVTLRPDGTVVATDLEPPETGG